MYKTILSINIQYNSDRSRVIMDVCHADVSYDNEHFIAINNKVDELNKRDDSSIFLDSPFTTRDI